MISTKIAAVIPARLASSRFPNKPLLPIEGLPMIEHVRRRALLCRSFSDVVVATCDPEIADCVQSYEGKVMMTSDQHKVATERVAEACRQLDCTHVVNVQGDEVLILPGDLDRMTQSIMENPRGPIWNAMAPVERMEDLEDPSIVKCIVSRGDRFLFCSRSFAFLEGVCQVIGILAYHRSFLENFALLEQTPLERRESIEQMRFLEYNWPIQGVRFSKGYPGINTPEEAEVVKKILKQDPVQHSILSQIL